MVENGYVTREEGDKAKAEPLGVIAAPQRHLSLRRRVFHRGSAPPDHLAATARMRFTKAVCRSARRSTRRCSSSPARRCSTGLLKYDTLRGYRGPVKTIEIGGDWGVPLGEVKGLADVPEWRLGRRSRQFARQGLRSACSRTRQISGEHRRGARERHGRARTTWALPCAMSSTASASRPIRRPTCSSRATSSSSRRTKARDSAYMLRQVPEVEGGLVAMDPHTGRVLAMVGGFSYAAVRVQPRHAGDAPARLVVQAVRLCGGARQWLHAGVGDHGRRRSPSRAATRSGRRRTMTASRPARRPCVPASSSRAT